MSKVSIVASENLIDIEIAGHGGHASSPHMAVDPVMVATNIIQSLQTIVSRTADPLDAIVISVTDIQTDGARNVIPSNVTINCDCRTFNDANTEMVEKRVNEIANAACQMAGATCRVSFSREFIVSVNTPAETEAAAAGSHPT